MYNKVFKILDMLKVNYSNYNITYKEHHISSSTCSFDTLQFYNFYKEGTYNTSRSYCMKNTYLLSKDLTMAKDS